MEKSGGYPSQAQMAQHLQHYPGTPSNVKREWYTNRHNSVSELGHRPSDDCQATCKKIAQDGIQTRPQERTERVIRKEYEPAGALDSASGGVTLSKPGMNFATIRERRPHFA